MVEKHRQIREISRRKQSDELIDPGINRIRKTWAKLGSRKLRAGPYGKQHLLEEIYTVYCGWRDQGLTEQIWARLAGRLSDQTIDRSAHLLDLLIRTALPQVRRNVATTWVDAIRYGEMRHVRPFKLRGFFYVNGGLVRCARLYRKAQQEKRGQEEIARLEEEDWEARSQQARRERRRRARRSMPVGMQPLFDR